LTLVLPDQSRSYIPASWTDLSEQEPKKLISQNSQSASNLIATTRHLLHARKIVDSLLCRLNSSEQENAKASREETNRAKPTGTVAPIPKPVPVTKDLEKPHRSTETKGDNRSGGSHQQDGPLRGQGSGGTP
jgi:hypothetical protein